MQVKRGPFIWYFRRYVHGMAGEDASGVFLCLVTHFFEIRGDLRSGTRKGEGLDGEKHRNEDKL